MLIAPLLWIAGRRWPDLLILAGAALAVAAPWYVLCYLRNGDVFIDEFIWKHHFRPFLQPRSAARPAMVVLHSGSDRPAVSMVAHVGTASARDERQSPKASAFGNGVRFRFLLGCDQQIAWLSVASAAARSRQSPGVRLDGGRQPTSGTMAFRPPRYCYCLPLRGGNSAASPCAGLRAKCRYLGNELVGVLPITAALALRSSGSLAQSARTYAIATMVMAATFGVIYLKWPDVPGLNRVVSARPHLAADPQCNPDRYCVGDLHRNMRYGLNYYTHQPLPDVRITTRP